MPQFIRALPTPNTSYIPPVVAQVFSHPTWDVILILALFGIGFFYGIARGRHKMFGSTLNIYVAIALMSAIPITTVARYSQTSNIFYVRIAVFIAIFIILGFLFRRGRPHVFARSNPWWQIFLLSILQVGLILHMIFSFLPPERVKTLAPLTRTVFANPNLHLWWLLIPMAFLIILRKLGMRDE